jgi:hypothetical protein
MLAARRIVRTGGFAAQAALPFLLGSFLIRPSAKVVDHGKRADRERLAVQHRRHMRRELANLLPVGVQLLPSIDTRPAKRTFQEMT